MPEYLHPSAGAVVVVGAGCVGLTTALRCLQAGYPVLVIAEHLPGGPLNARYASPTAGAHHLSFADNADWRQRFLDQRTFDVLWSESEDAAGAEHRGLMRLTQTEYYTEDEVHLRFLEQLPDFRVLPEKSLPSFAKHSCYFTSLTIEPSRYMPYLVKRVEALGGIIKRVQRLSSIRQACQYARHPIAIMNCTGLGARDLDDVCDKEVHPVRGQVLCLDAPWLKSGWTFQIGSLSGGEGGARTYIIPRSSGEVIIGGTREADDWNEKPRPETSEDILRRALQICPILPGPSVEGQSDDIKLAKLRTLVKAEVVGFRPTRRQGIRLEHDKALSKKIGTPIVHNYGHGGYGWQSCWGSGEEAVRIAGEAIRAAQTGSMISAKL